MKQLQKHNLLVQFGFIALVVAMLGLVPSQSSAQEVQITGPLAGQPAVRNMRQYRGERFNVIPTVGYTLQDEFSRTLFFGIEANYHIFEWLGIGVWGGYAPLKIDTDLTSQVVRAGQTSDYNRLSLPGREGFSEQVGRIQWALSAHLIFIPLRGKLSLFQSLFVDTDFYVLVGAGAFGLEERAPYNSADTVGGVQNPCGGADPGGASTAQCLSTQRARASRVAFAPMFGVGLSTYFNSWVGLTFEWRAFPFSWNPSGTDEGGRNAQGALGGGPFPDGNIDGNDSRLTFNHMMQIGLVFNLPADQRISE